MVFLQDNPGLMRSAPVKACEQVEERGNQPSGQEPEQQRPCAALGQGLDRLGVCCRKQSDVSVRRACERYERAYPTQNENDARRDAYRCGEAKDSDVARRMLLDISQGNRGGRHNGLHLVGGFCQSLETL